MRVRTRALSTSPYYNGNDPCIESITDLEPNGADKSWKPCGHSRVRVVSLQPCRVRIGGSNLASSAPVSWGPEIEAAKYLPFGSFEDTIFSGYFRDVLEVAPPPVLPAFDANGAALDISRSSTNLAEMMATMKQTAAMLAKPGKFFRHLTKKNDIVYTERTPLSELRSAIDRAGSTWLEGTYGYLPLISDLIELSSIAVNPRKALDKLKKPIKRDYRDANQVEYTYSRDPQTPIHGTRLARSTTVTASRLIRIEGQPNPTFQAMGLINQMATYLGLNDFGRLAWELVPYSFVLDWFTSMGSSIGSAAALNGHLAYCDIRFSSAIRTTRVEKYSVVPPGVTEVTYWWPYRRHLDVKGGYLETEHVTFSRSKSGEAVLGGDLVVNGLNACRTTSGIALLLGRLGSLSRW